MPRWSRLVGLTIEWTCHGVPWIATTAVWLSLLWSYAAEFSLPRRKAPSIAGWTFERWLSGPNVFLFPDQWTKACCLLFSLLLDASVVGILKSVIRRPRPKGDNNTDMHLTVPQDIWSFPSGHASRAILLLWLLPDMFHFQQWHLMLLGVWALVVCVSRYAMQRHHLTDILAGVLLGFLQYHFVILIDWPALLYTLWFGR